jgi:PKHD-type hydroxylase
MTHNKINDFVVVDLFTPEECEKIIKHCKKNYKSKDAALEADGIIHEETRKTKISWISKNKKMDIMIKDKLRDAVLAINEQKYNFNLDSSEKVQFGEYGAGGHYTWHVDLGNEPTGECRKLTICVQLSDECNYGGGNLMLLVGGNQYYTVNNKQGQAIIFPSWIPHIVTEVETKPGSS